MAMVRTPHTDSSKNPRYRPTSDVLDSSTSGMNNSQATENTQKEEDTVETLLADTSERVNRSIRLLNQTRNMKGELKSGIADNLVVIQRQVQKMIHIIEEEERERREKGIRKECNCLFMVQRAFECFKQQYQSDLEEVRDYLIDAAALNVDSIHNKIDEEIEKTIKTVSEKVEQVAGTLNGAVRERRVEVPEEPERMAHPTYASVTRRNLEPKYRTLHSLIVEDTEDIMPTSEIVQEVGKIVEAKKEGIQIDRIRKGKGRKVIIGFRNKKDRDRVKEKIENVRGNLDVQTIQNKDPQVVLYGVLKTNTDDDIVEAIRSQNRHLVEDILGGTEDRISIKYKKRGKDDHTQHVVLNVSPVLWARFTEAGHLYIDVQRVRVADQSPLIQCSRCLGYGHGRRFCSAAEEKCAHCSGTHHQSECVSLKEGKGPCCTNCTNEQLQLTNHHAFSAECPVRQRWDAIARATVAYVPEDK